jgi:hypothetical protein
VIIVAGQIDLTPRRLEGVGPEHRNVDPIVHDKLVWMGWEEPTLAAALTDTITPTRRASVA